MTEPVYVVPSSGEVECESALPSIESSTSISSKLESLAAFVRSGEDMIARLRIKAEDNSAIIYLVGGFIATALLLAAIVLSIRS